MTILSISGKGECLPFSRPGDSVDRFRWAVASTGDSIMLDLDVGERTYNGTLQERSFTASFREPSFVAMPCYFREASISGTFAEDLSSFEAHETQILGPPGDETRLELDWRARRTR